MKLYKASTESETWGKISYKKIDSIFFYSIFFVLNFINSLNASFYEYIFPVGLFCLYYIIAFFIKFLTLSLLKWQALYIYSSEQKPSAVKNKKKFIVFELSLGFY